jgi:glucose-1-phosphate cytidylyltransferase
MKVVLFCGGLGTRLREHSDSIPKPLVNIGHRPIIWHLMRYYAHYGHKEFILCLGYRGDLIRDYFLNYREEMTNDFTLDCSNRSVALHSEDSSGWKITFVDTGLHSNIGQRLLRAKKYLQGEEMFLANYADGLSNVPIDQQIAEFSASTAIGNFVAVHSSQSFHAVQMEQDGLVSSMGAMSDQALWINGGFFVLRKEIFSNLEEGDELVEKPFSRLIAQRRLVAFRWNGFWQSMDTFKDKITFDRMEAQGKCPWMVWNSHPAATGGGKDPA